MNTEQGSGKGQERNSRAAALSVLVRQLKLILFPQHLSTPISGSRVRGAMREHQMRHASSNTKETQDTTITPAYSVQADDPAPGTWPGYVLANSCSHGRLCCVIVPQ